MERVVERVLEEESAKREHVVVALAGSRAFGFPSKDSDWDLECVHVIPTAKLVGLSQPTLTFDRIETIEGVEIDYTSNELGPFISGCLGGNGNYLERVLGRSVLIGSPLLDELRPLVQRSLSRRAHRHYRGFAQGQLLALEKEPNIKKVLYVLRTALTGLHLLKTGELEPDLQRLLEAHGPRDAMALLEAKRTGERFGADPKLLEEWRPRVGTVLDDLDAALETSSLPMEPPNVDALEAWLLEVRRARLA